MDIQGTRRQQLLQGSSLQGGSGIPLQSTSSPQRTASAPQQTAIPVGTANPMNFMNVEQPQVGGGGGNTNTPTPQPSAADIAAARAAERAGKLRGEIRGYQPQIEEIYNQLFADLDMLIKSRSKDIDASAGDNINKLTESYVGAIPRIESSYAALGAGDSTDNTYAKVDAKKGFEDSTAEVGKQKQKDLSTLGEYDQTTRAGWGADRDALNRIFGRLDETENEQDLANSRNEVENKLGTAKASRASLMTDDGLRGKIAGATDPTSRMQSIQASLDALLNGSMSGGVKDAAFAAVGKSAGLSEEEKNQIKANSGYTS